MPKAAPAIPMYEPMEETALPKLLKMPLPSAALPENRLSSAEGAALTLPAFTADPDEGLLA
ncbi:hypothetical protein NBRC106471_1879 [Acetobacter pasteurianus subsp. pasteurianus LMG 1262 = NBRC 106471]|nr:hypothetical protein NBRC106471_1879 [Acetobacter pasteurianus subsp. pasteurianus LMG 1262 = NBRC 106471]